MFREMNVGSASRIIRMGFRVALQIDKIIKLRWEDVIHAFIHENTLLVQVDITESQENNLFKDGTSMGTIVHSGYYTNKLLLQ